MPLGAAAQLEESDILSGGVREEPRTVRPELQGIVASMSSVEAIGERRVFLPDVFARILLVRGSKGGDFRAYVVGSRTLTLRKDPARQRAIMLRLWPGAVPVLMAISAREVAGTIVPLEAMWGESIRGWLGALAETQSEPRRMAMIEEQLLARVRTSGAAGTTARSLVDFDVSDGERVAAAAKRLGVSERHLRRIFDEAVGLSPKAYLRVVRLRRALRLARRGATTWTRVAADAGYFDQAHMVAEFRDLTGRSPTALCRELEGPGAAARRGRRERFSTA